MKVTLVLIFISVILVSACSKSDDKTEDNCKYNLDIVPKDSSLFISFEIDGNVIKFYQGDFNLSDTGKIYNHFDYNETKTIYSYYHSIGFGDMYRSGQYYPISPMLTLSFYNYSVLDEAKAFQIPFLSEIIETRYNYTTPPANAVISDSIFMHGISISLSTYNSTEKDVYSTGNVLQYFGYNVDSITDFYFGSSYFEITRAMPVCEKYIMIQGRFSTTLYKESPFNERELDNGKFTFLLRQ